MVIVSKMRDGKYISLCYKISVFYFERVFHSFLMSQAPERYIIEYLPYIRPPTSTYKTNKKTRMKIGDSS